MGRVTEWALIKRINRQLAKEGEALKVARGVYEYSDLGRYYIVNLYTNFVMASHITPEKLGREMNVLKPYEELAAE